MALEKLNFKEKSGYALKADLLDKDYLDPRDFIIDIPMKDVNVPTFYLRKQIILPKESLLKDESRLIFNQVCLSNPFRELNENLSFCSLNMTVPSFITVRNPKNINCSERRMMIFCQMQSGKKTLMFKTNSSSVHNTFQTIYFANMILR